MEKKGKRKADRLSSENTMGAKYVQKNLILFIAVVFLAQTINSEVYLHVLETMLI